jgi:hypothetical protein
MVICKLMHDGDGFLHKGHFEWLNWSVTMYTCITFYPWFEWAWALILCGCKPWFCRWVSLDFVWMWALILWGCGPWFWVGVSLDFEWVWALILSGCEPWFCVGVSLDFVWVWDLIFLPKIKDLFYEHVRRAYLEEPIEKSLMRREWEK